MVFSPGTCFIQLHHGVSLQKYWLWNYLLHCHHGPYTSLLLPLDSLQANSPFLVSNSLATCQFLSITANQTHPHSFSGDFPSLQFYHWYREWNPFNGYSAYHSSLIMNVSLFHPHLLSFHPPCPTFPLSPQNHLNVLMISGLGLFLCPLPTVTLHAVKINTILSSLWLTAAKFQSNKQLQITCLGNSRSEERV